MTYELSEYQLREIAKLPLWIQQFKDKYPVAISNVAEDYELPPLTDQHQLSDIEVYYGDDVDEEALFIRNGRLAFLDRERPVNPDVIRIAIDGEFAYIQVDGYVVLNRLGEVKLPVVVVDPEIQDQAILTISH